jgi:hypothetical protein
MRRYLLLAVSAVSLSACDLTSGGSFTGPSGALANTAKCSQSPDGCFQKASLTCGGPYLVLDSESHAGGVFTDAVQGGPVTWYAMTYQCGASDGKMPAFPFRGLPTVNANINIQQR